MALREVVGEGAAQLGKFGEERGDETTNVAFVNRNAEQVQHSFEVTQ